VILIAKPVATFAVMLWFRYPLRTTVAVAVSTAQIGEFSFLLAATGMTLGLLDERATNTLIAAGIISIILNPVLYRLVHPLEGVLARLMGRQAASDGGHDRSKEDLEDGVKRHRAVVVGYGPVGQGLVRVLQENQIQPVVVELNLQTVRGLAAADINAVYGDAAHRQTLVEAGLPGASVLILSCGDMQGIEEAIRLARELNPEIQIIARTSYIVGVSRLRRAGADVVFSSEGEVTLAMTEYLRSRFLLMAERSDRERQRLQIELLGDRQDAPGPRNDAASHPGADDQRSAQP
jgi:CPA2 family monovalent cation:H+ antiporter-2